jgi:uroporphyrinogen decarboxylase
MKKVNYRSQMIAALSHKRPEVVPYEVEYTLGMTEAMVNYTSRTDFDSRYIEPVLTRIDLHPGGKYIKPGFYQDCFGAIWNRTVEKSIGVVESYVINPATIKTYRFPEILPQQHLAGCRRQIESPPGLFRLGCLNFSFWERAWILRGMENLFMDMAADPTFAHDYLGRICDYNCSLIERSLKTLDLDGFHFGDDWGTQTGLQMSPQMWRVFFKPYLKRMYAIVRDAGKFVSIHSCGKVQELFDELLDIGVNSFNPFQPEVIDVDWATKKYKGKLCFWGGLSTQKTLPFGTPDQTYNETSHLINLGRDGGMIVAPAHSIPRDAKPENVIAMLEALRDNCGN